MNANVVVGILAAVAWLPGMWGVWEAIKQRRARSAKDADQGERLVVKSALELLQPYTKRVAELEASLDKARSRVHEMSAQLEAANHQITAMTDQLADARTEMSYLRLQVKTLSQQLPDGPK